LLNKTFVRHGESLDPKRAALPATLPGEQGGVVPELGLALEAFLWVTGGAGRHNQCGQKEGLDHFATPSIVGDMKILVALLSAALMAACGSIPTPKENPALWTAVGVVIVAGVIASQDNDKQPSSPACYVPGPNGSIEQRLC